MNLETFIGIAVIVGAFILGALAMCVVGVLLGEVPEEFDDE
jgi:hypothetical protein